MVTICIIPARGGSKRIPKKNIKNFLGKPIIAYSIEAAISSGCFDRVIVSTDDPGIAKVAMQFGAEAPFLRPKKLSDDHTGFIPVIKHAIEWLEENENDAIDIACAIYATAPFITASNIIKSLEYFKEKKSGYCFSATTFPFPIQRAFKINKEARVEMFEPENYNKRSQDLEEAYQDAAQFYWGHASEFKKGTPAFSDKASVFVLPRHLVQDIDTPEDWLRAELMYQVVNDKRSIDY